MSGAGMHRAALHAGANAAGRGWLPPDLAWRGGAAGLAGLLLLAAWLAPLPDVAEAPLPDPARGEAGVPAAPPFGPYAEIMRVPLFHANRLPFTPPPPAPPPPAPPPAPTPLALAQYHLTGVVVSADGRSALLRSSRDGRTLLLREGESLDGWMLREVTAEAAIFAQESPAGAVRHEVTFPDVKRVAE